MTDDEIDYKAWAEEEADFSSATILHHIDQMYPAMWKAVSKSARLSIRNTIRREVVRLLLSDDLRAELKGQTNA